MTPIKITSKFADELVEKYKTIDEQAQLNKILILLKESHDEKDSDTLNSNIIALRNLG